MNFGTINQIFSMAKASKRKKKNAFNIKLIMVNILCFIIADIYDHNKNCN